MKFNINEHVRVKLSAQGLHILREQHKELLRMCPALSQYEEPAVDDEGYTRFQMHSLMTKFGANVGLGMTLPFETEIIIEDPHPAPSSDGRKEI